jgi:kinesin family member C2/C3
VGAHDMNEHSSRSHMILQLRMQGVSKIDNISVNAKLNLIDLAGTAAPPRHNPPAVLRSDRSPPFLPSPAGSERVAKTEATGERLSEGVAINKSLLAL